MQPSLPFDAPISQHAAPGTRDPEQSTQPAAPGTRHPELVLAFVRHPRARRYVIRVADDGTVRVTVPRWGSKREAAAFADAQRAWIEKQLGRAEEARLRQRADASLTLSQSKGDLLARATAERALRERASRELPARLLDLAAQHRLTVSRVSVRNQRWRWGSCSRSGHICLNWRLIQMPDAIRDYVLIHELMHLKRMDHSPMFWKLVAGACPDFQSARAWLREHRQR